MEKPFEKKRAIISRELICLHNEMVMSELLSGMLVCCAWTGREFTSELMTQVRVVRGTSSVPDYYILQLLYITSFAFLVLLLTISPSVAGPHPDSLFTVHSVLRAPKGVHHLRHGGEAGVPGSNIGEC